MNRNEFVSKMNKQAKLVRTEYNFTQERMSQILGVSKKTLVEIEKGRSSLGWAGAVVLCSVFAKSEVLAGVLGGEPADIIMALAFEGDEPQYPRTMGGKVWWRQTEEYRDFRIQQNILLQHYRALNQGNERICASFDLSAIKTHLDRISEEG